MTADAGKEFLELIADNRKGTAKGIYSVCSAHPDVLGSCFEQTLEDGSLILIESTSNQVDQYGGYTGMKPGNFVAYVLSFAEKTGFPAYRILLGGDHLGPNAWQSLPAEEAMKRAEVLIEEYVRAGYRKIHLDTSMFLADDERQSSLSLPDEIVASRAARLCRIAEDAQRKYHPAKPGLMYIIGTEVPIPGGAREAEDHVEPTSAENAANTLEVTRRSFLESGLHEAWDRVVGIVVQPGVEFGDDQVFGYDRKKASTLSKMILTYENLVYEAHSTDYQAESSLKALVEDHFCILKVGPWLTFAYREALFSLETIETELLGEDHPGKSGLKDTLERIMAKEPGYWKKYYHGDDRQQQFKRRYSFSDRSRYYWTNPEIARAKDRLFDNLMNHRIPLSLLSQFMPAEFRQVQEGIISSRPQDLVYSHIRNVVSMYSRACGLAAK